MIVTKSSTEAELVALPACVGQDILLRKFLMKQSFKMGPVVASQQDNMFTLPLIYLGPSALHLLCLGHREGERWRAHAHVADVCESAVEAGTRRSWRTLPAEQLAYSPREGVCRHVDNICAGHRAQLALQVAVHGVRRDRIFDYHPLGFQTLLHLHPASQGSPLFARPK